MQHVTRCRKATYGVMSSEPDASVLRRSIDDPDCFGVLFDFTSQRAATDARRRLVEQVERREVVHTTETFGRYSERWLISYPVQAPSSR